MKYNEIRVSTQYFAFDSIADIRIINDNNLQTLE